VVVYRGAARPAIVFVGEAPGRLEDLSGRPFVGRAGHRLDAAVDRLGLEADRWGVLNVVKCRPPGNRLGPEPLRACRPFLDRQLDLLRPRLLVPLGARALSALDPEAPAISVAAGAPRSAGGRWLFPLLHPAAGFRSRWAAARWERDIDRLQKWLEPRLETL
jgi:uracil-DNA glycosylase